MPEEVVNTHYVITYTVERVDMVIPKKDQYDKTAYDPKRRVTRLAQNSVKSTMLDRALELTGRHMALTEDIEGVIDPIRENTRPVVNDRVR